MSYLARRKRKKKYKLPMPEHGYRGGGERSPDEGPVVPPNKKHPRGKRYSPRNRPT
jgi:hypothetical protein